MPPDDRTILEGSSPDESPSGGNPGDGSTIIEGASADSSTIIEGTQARAEASLNLVAGGKFLEYTLQEQLETKGAEADLWFIADTQGKEYVLKLYRYRIKPKEEITEKVRSLRVEHVVDVKAVGEAGGRHYEIQEKIQQGSLADLAKGGKMPEEQLKQVVRQLGGAIDHLHEVGIIHRDIKPANILVRTLEPLDLVLTDFGISSEGGTSIHMTGLSRTASYSAPEAMTGGISKALDWWGVGVIILELLKGKHPFAGMDERAVNFQLVDKGIEVPEEIGQEWQLLLKGLLTRKIKNRWRWLQVGQWLGGKRDIATAYEGDQQEETPGQQRPYKFSDEKHSDTKSLAQAYVDNWEQAKKDVRRGSPNYWVDNILEDKPLTDVLEWVAENEDLNDGEKVSCALMVMSPKLPPVYEGQLVTRDWLFANPHMAIKIANSKLPELHAHYRSTDSFQLKDLKEGIEQIEDQLKSKAVAFPESQQLPEDLAEGLKVSAALVPSSLCYVRGEYIEDDKWLSDNWERAHLLLQGPWPQVLKQRTGRDYFIRKMDKLHQDKVYIASLGLEVDQSKLDQFLLMTPERLQAAFEQWKVQWVDSGEASGSEIAQLDAAIHQAKNRMEVDDRDVMALLASSSTKHLISAEQLRVIEDLESLKQKQFGEMDEAFAKRLIEVGDWEILNRHWLEIRENPLHPLIESDDRLRSIALADKAEYLDVVGLVARNIFVKIHSPAKREAQHRPPIAPLSEEIIPRDKTQSPSSAQPQLTIPRVLQQQRWVAQRQAKVLEEKKNEGKKRWEEGIEEGVIGRGFQITIYLFLGYIIQANLVGWDWFERILGENVKAGLYIVIFSIFSLCATIPVGQWISKLLAWLGWRPEAYIAVSCPKCSYECRAELSSAGFYQVCHECLSKVEVPPYDDYQYEAKPDSRSQANPR